MNKGELVDAIAAGSGLTKMQAEKALSSTVDAISGALKAGEAVTLIGFGSFKVAERSARQGKNPRTGEAIKIAARKVPRFSAGQSLKDAVGGTKKKAAPVKKAAPAKKAVATPAKATAKKKK